MALRVEAIVFCGIQASGKTTFYVQRCLHTHVRISLDVLRTRRRERLLLEACLEAGQPFVVDNTNATRGERERYVAPAREAEFRTVACLFDAHPREAIARNQGRPPEQRIPVPGIYGAYKRLEPPSVEEGFDELLRVTIAPGGQFAVAPLGGPGA
ncbi:MAG TPA: AAA family ATPase [Thermoleophilaceae bacterium]|nr:AAA family ATPase [Thermoleophilaceae bacterium]